MLYLTTDYLASDLYAKHWQNECISNHEEFDTENNKHDRCLISVFSKVCTNPFPSKFE